MPRAMIKRTDEQKLAIIEKIDEAKQKGVTMNEACKEAGIANSLYYSFRNQLKKTKGKKTNGKKPYAVTIEAPQVLISTQRVVAVMGTPNEVAEVIKQWQA